METTARDPTDTDMTDLPLPIPGASNGVWGDVVNNFLQYLNSAASTNATNIGTVTTNLNLKSDIGHTHTTTDITNLQTFVDGRIASVGGTGSSSGSGSTTDGYLFVQDATNPHLLHLYG